MKKYFFILGLLMAFLLGMPAEEISDEKEILTEQGRILPDHQDEKGMQKRFEQISNDMRNSNCLTPRRHVQSTYSITHPRVIRNAVKIIQYVRLKEVNKLLRITEYETLRQTINYSSLLCLKGYHVYTLRKIII